MHEHLLGPPSVLQAPHVPAWCRWHPRPPARASRWCASLRGRPRTASSVAARNSPGSAAHAVTGHVYPAPDQAPTRAFATAPAADTAPAANGAEEPDAAQPLPRSPAQLRNSKAVLENAITTAVVDFSRRDEPQAAASTQFAIITEQLPLDRAAAEGWLVKLVPPADLQLLLGLRSLLALSITDTAKVLITCPQLLNLSRRDLCDRLMGLRAALPATDVPAVVRKRPQLLLDEDAPSKAERALKRLKALMPAYDVEALLAEGGETWYNFRSML